ncbi:ricin-type beta-trefoil lectin domain protein [Agaribacter flavus]|uniref:Ricin-type beta-trefoil lectin domain protein n=1 Tax=Agaribacter flavus TaxID=1902781 RepID=A0ABV7FSD2_9ALTE
MKYHILSATLCTLLYTTGALAQTVEHSSGKCLRTANNSASPANGTNVVLSDNCSGGASQFSWTPGGSVKHVPTNKCIHPGGATIPSNGTELVLWDGCDFADRVRFNRTGGGSLQQKSSGKCVHPFGGSANPANGTKLVMWDGCNETRLAFTPNSSTTDNSVSNVSGDLVAANAAQLVSAIARANAGDTITLTANFSASQSIVVDKRVVIEGNGKTINHSVPRTGSFAEYTPAFIVAASNVIIRNLSVVGDNRNGLNTLIELNNQGSTRSNNLTVYNVTLQNATAGIRNRGIIPSNLVIENSTFRNLNKAVDLTRDALLSNFTRVSTNLFDAKGDRLFWQQAGSLRIRNNSFYVDAGQAPMQVGIQIDGGNDGYNPNVSEAPGFPNNTFAARGNNDNLIIKFNNGMIENNHGRLSRDPIRASEFPIAVAKVASVTIEDNFVETVGSTNDQFDFSSGINVEHMSRDVTIVDNAIAVNRVVNGAQNNQGVSILPYQDHGSQAESEEGSINIKVLNNAFYGSGKSGIFGFSFRNLEIDGNNFNNFTGSRPGVATINLFNTDDNRNGVLDANERATLTGGFTNFGATSNLGASGLIEATIFNTDDPSDLPPDQRHN